MPKDLPEYGKGWGGRIIEKNGMYGKNYGTGGATVIPGIAYDSNIPMLSLSEQLDKAQDDYENQSIDYIIFNGGCNDADQTKTVLPDEEIKEYNKINWDDYPMIIKEGEESKSFAAQLDNFISEIVKTYPHAKVGYIITPKMGGSPYNTNRYRQFYDIAAEVCKKWGIPVLDLWYNTPLNPSLAEHKAEDSDWRNGYLQPHNDKKLYVDAQHLTKYGYDFITPIIETWMKGL